MQHFLGNIDDNYVSSDDESDARQRNTAIVITHDTEV